MYDECNRAGSMRDDIFILYTTLQFLLQLQQVITNKNVFLFLVMSIPRTCYN